MSSRATTTNGRLLRRGRLLAAEPASPFGSFPGARCFGAEELQAVRRVIEAQSPYRFYGLRLLRRCEALEALCRRRFERRYALAVSSGTAALHSALAALQVGEGDEVILPAYGWSAALMAVVALRATPVIAPIDETLSLDPAALRRCLSRRTKAIIAIHMRGQPCDMQAILTEARQRGIPVIEDGAQCLGGRIGGRPVGAMGDVSIFSFQVHKVVTAGEGGVLLTNDRSIFQRALQFHDLGMRRRAGRPNPRGRAAIRSFGLNYRLSELQAAVLLAQLRKLPNILAALRRNDEAARAALEPACMAWGLRLRPVPRAATRNHAFLCLQAGDAASARRAAAALARQDVPVELCSTPDAHHFDAWLRWLGSVRYPYRVIASAQSRAWLAKTLAIEVAPSARMAAR